jgi:pimeloyl-ACP methyl ester carboxylesterase
MAANSTPVVFIHGLWLHSQSWQNWVDLYREAGYNPIAPEWPGTPETVAEARAHPESAGGYGVADVADHFAQVIGGLDAKPVVIGHSFGGLVAQILLGRDLAIAGVAIDPAPIKGVLTLPLSSLRSGFPVLKNPANRKRAVALTPEQFRYGFTNEVSAQESADLHERWTIASPGRPLFEAAFANVTTSSATKVNTGNATRGPLLLIAGLKDHTVPPSIVKATLRRYRRSPAVTELKEFSGRGHSIVIDSGWREVAEGALAWLKSRTS